jgi:pyridoxamine 5'-phosphate oxidase family protein
MTFKPHEITFLREADLGRLATVQPDGSPQVSPVGFSYNEELGTIDIGGYRMSKSQKFRNIAHNAKVAFVVDDILSRNPWRVRCLEIRGTAEQGRAGSPAGDWDSGIIRITPQRIISFGIDEPDTEAHQLTVDSRNV